MGITNNNFEFLLDNYNLLENKKIITIGRQQKYFNLKNFKKNLIIKKILSSNNFEQDLYVDNIFKEISHHKTTSIDFSDERGQTNIKFNLNNLIPKKYHKKFDTLIDGGSIEHILDLKNCIQNYKNLIKKNGHLFIFTTANNYFGHGFYQFSLEFFNKIFSLRNGFKVLDLVLCEHNFPGAELSKQNKWFRPVKSSENKYKRFSIVNDKPIMIYALIRNTNHKKISFDFIQSDYSKSKKNTGKKNGNFRKFLIKNLKMNKNIYDYVYGLKQKKEFRLTNKSLFKRY